MKRFLRGLFYFLSVLLIFFIGFLIYATRPALDASRFPSNKILHFLQFDSKNLASPSSLKVISYNIGYASGLKNNQGAILSREEVQQNLESIASALKKQDPDLVFLQEVDFHAARSFDINQLNFLAEKLRMPYAAYVVTWNKNYVAWPYWPLSRHFGRIVSGQALLSRFPIKNQNLLFFPKPRSNPFWYNWFYLDRIVQIFDIEMGDRVIPVYNVHLEAFDRVDRKAQLETLASNIPAKHKFFKIVAGDFNLDANVYLDPTSPRADERKLLQDFAAQSGSNWVGAGQNYKTVPSWKPQEWLDHIFYSGFELKQSGVAAETTASDHLPLQVELIFP